MGSLSLPFPANRELYREVNLNIAPNMIKSPVASEILYGKEELIEFRTGNNRELAVYAIVVYFFQ